MEDTTARSYFEKAKGFEDIKIKAKYLKSAYHAASSSSLQSEIVFYALSYGINLDRVNGF